mmetsp:Transcript_130585/g.194499  ORF Transcript_130585/g.194499 Transcript_130585/m.194499 type:complete len:297 (+) Transcript_130585:443-1333(+)
MNLSTECPHQLSIERQWTKDAPGIGRCSLPRSPKKKLKAHLPEYHTPPSFHFSLFAKTRAHLPDRRRVGSSFGLSRLPLPWPFVSRISKVAHLPMSPAKYFHLGNVQVQKYNHHFLSKKTRNHLVVSNYDCSNYCSFVHISVHPTPVLLHHRHQSLKVANSRTSVSQPSGLASPPSRARPSTANFFEVSTRRYTHVRHPSHTSLRHSHPCIGEYRRSKTKPRDTIPVFVWSSPCPGAILYEVQKKIGWNLARHLRRPRHRQPERRVPPKSRRRDLRPTGFLSSDETKNLGAEPSIR